MYETKVKNVDLEKIQTCVSHDLLIICTTLKSVITVPSFIIGVFKVLRRQSPEVVKSFLGNF